MIQSIGLATLDGVHQPHSRPAPNPGVCPELTATAINYILECASSSPESTSQKGESTGAFPRARRASALNITLIWVWVVGWLMALFLAKVPVRDAELTAAPACRQRVACWGASFCQQINYICP